MVKENERVKLQKGREKYKSEVSNEKEKKKWKN